MDLRKPTAVNNRDKPVIIFKNKVELKESPTIKQAAKWLKNYLGLDYMPFSRIMDGITEDEQWEFNGDVFQFTTNDKVGFEKLKAIKNKGKSGKVKPTGYWTFFCNPEKWAIDDFLTSGKVYDTFSITKWQKDWFRTGQLGVIRVGHDNRKKSVLKGKNKLARGVYAVVEVLGKPILSASRDDHWLEENEGEKLRYRVPIKYLNNLLFTPILLEEINVTYLEVDKFILDGFQGSSYPLEPETFNLIIDHIGGFKKLNFEFDKDKIDSSNKLAEIEEKYIGAVPEVKERVSKYIERGVIAKEYKKRMGFKCQLCEALELNPYSFKKPNGDYYIETHHVIPVSELQVGSLSTNNLLTLCANHHRQIHYGNVEIIENNQDKFIFNIDDRVVEIEKK